MNILQAYAAAPHGGAIVRPGGGARVERWISAKPGLPPPEIRFIQQNIGNFSGDDVAADDWEVEAP